MSLTFLDVNRLFSAVHLALMNFLRQHATTMGMAPDPGRNVIARAERECFAAIDRAVATYQSQRPLSGKPFWTDRRYAKATLEGGPVFCPACGFDIQPGQAIEIREQQDPGGRLVHRVGHATKADCPNVYD